MHQLCKECDYKLYILRAEYSRYCQSSHQLPLKDIEEVKLLTTLRNQDKGSCTVNDCCHGHAGQNKRKSNRTTPDWLEY